MSSGEDNLGVIIAMDFHKIELLETRKQPADYHGRNVFGCSDVRDLKIPLVAEIAAYRKRLNF